MDAPQLPGAEPSASADGGLPPGQASAFRRALDAQVESADPTLALVPSGPHDLTRPIDVSALRAALAGGQGNLPPSESVPGFPEAVAAPRASFPQAAGVAAGSGTNQAPASGSASVSASTAIAGMTAVVPRTPAGSPSPNGPTVVVPRVSVPGLHAPTKIAKPTSTSLTVHDDAAGKGVAAVPPSAAAAGAGNGPEQDPEQEQDHSPRHSGGSGKPSRLPTTIGLAVLLAAIAATALVLIDVGHSGGPLAPSAMPAKSSAPAHSAAAAPPRHSAAPTTHKPSPPASHSPSHSASASPSAPKPSPSPSTVPSFATIRWTSAYQPMVADIQSRLAKLRYLAQTGNGSQYVITQRTAYDTGNRWWQPSDQVGFYQSATSSAIRAFKYDYLQHGQGRPPGDGSCDTATYQALVNATS